MRPLLTTVGLALAACAPLVDFLTEDPTSSPPPPERLAAALACKLVPVPPGPSWGEAELPAAEVRARRAWRTPGASGASCAHCHSPEPLEFAVTALSDEDVVRHARRHAPEPVVRDAVDFLHVLRQRHGLRQVCDWPLRPFQPTGAVLPGGDLAFGQALAERGLKVTTMVRTADDATAAWAELAGLDVSSLALAVPLPPLSSVGSLDDWMTHGPVPGKDEVLFALHDAVLERRDAASAEALAGFLLAEASPPSSFPAPPGVAPAWVRALNVQKHAAGTWLHVGLARLLAGEVAVAAPALERAFAQRNDEDPCGGDDACSLTSMPLLPAGQGTDSPPGATVERTAQELSMRWWLLAWVRDPSLLNSSERPAPEGSHYGRTWNFDAAHAGFLQPLLHAIRSARQQQAFSAFLRGEGAAPSVNMRPPPLAVRTLLLDGGWALFPGWTRGVARGDGPALSSARLRLNLIRAVLLTQRAALSSGASVADRFTLLATLEGFERFVTEERTSSLERRARGVPTFDVREAPVLLDDTLALLAEVAAGIQAAPEVPVPRAEPLLEP